MVILNSTPEDVNFYQMNMIHDVGHDYFGNASRVRYFGEMKEMVNEYLSSFKIQSGGKLLLARKIGVKTPQNKKVDVKKLKKRLKTDKSLMDDLQSTAYSSVDPVEIDDLQSTESSTIFSVDPVEIDDLQSTESSTIFSVGPVEAFREYMEENIRPMLENIFYQLHFYYYTLKFNMETLKFDKYVSESVFGNEFKSVDNSMHDNMYNKFVMLCWDLFNNNITDLENYKNLTSQNLVVKEKWATFWEYLTAQYGGADRDFECTDKSDYSFTITPLSKDGTKFNKETDVKIAFVDNKYIFSSGNVSGRGTSLNKKGIIKWIQERVTNSKINIGETDEITARKNQVNDCISKEVDRIVGNLSKLPSTNADPKNDDPKNADPKNAASKKDGSKNADPKNAASKKDGSKKDGSKKDGSSKKNVSKNDGSASKPTTVDTDDDTDDDTSSSASTVKPDTFIMIVMAWFYQNFIGDYGDTMNHFLRAESDVFELFEKIPKSKWTEQDENIIRASQHIVSSHSKSIEKDDLSNVRNMNTFRSKISTLPNGRAVNKYVVDNAGKIFHFSSGSSICSVSSMMDGITIESNAVECQPLRTLPLTGSIMTAPEIGRNMAVYLQSVENRAGTEYDRHVKLERCFSDENNVVFNASFVGNGSNRKNQTFTSTMTMSKKDDKVKPKFSFKYDHHNLNLTQQRLNIDPDFLFKNAVIVAADIFRCATQSLINLKKDNEFQGWTNNVTANREKIIARIVLSAYSCLIFKSLGDILQEWNAVLKGGGYVQYVKNLAEQNKVEPMKDGDNHAWEAPSYGTDIAENERFLRSDSEPIRVIFCADRPSATRVLWSLYNAKKRLDCNSDWSSWINSNCTGGHMYRELDDLKGIQTLGDNDRKDNQGNNRGTIYQPLNTVKIDVGITKSVKNYFMYNAGKEESYTFESSNFILDNALADDINKNVSITFNNGDYTVSFGDGEFTFDDIRYPGNTNEKDRKPHPIVFNLLSEWLLKHEIIINDNGNGNNPVVTSMKQGSLLCYRKRGIDLNNYYMKRLNKQISEEYDQFYIDHKNKINSYLDNVNFKCMMQSLKQSLSESVPFTVYLLPKKFAKAYEGTSIVDSSVIVSDNIFTVKNCPTPDAEKSSASKKRSRQQQVDFNAVSKGKERADFSPLTKRSARFTRGSPSTETNNTTSSPMDEDDTETSLTETDEDATKVFTLQEIKKALKPAVGINYEKAKRKFSEGMTLEQIKNVRLPIDVNEKQKNAFYNNLSQVSMKGGATEENMNPLVYAVVSVGALVLALTGLQM